MGIKSPTPYRFREIGSIEYGMNFAYGGTGVFETPVAEPNMTIQISLFEQLLEEKLYTEEDLKSSIALVSLSGNDYNAYIARGGSLLVSTWTSISLNKIKLNTVIFSMAYCLWMMYIFSMVELTSNVHFRVFQPLLYLLLSSLAWIYNVFMIWECQK